MGIFDKLLKKTAEKKKTNNHAKALESPECRKLMELRIFMRKLLESHRYTAKSEYLNQIDDAQETIKFFNVLKDSQMLAEFCKKYNVKESYVDETLRIYNDFENLIDEKNEKYIQKALVEEKDFLDNALKAVDPVIDLDEDQRRVVLSDEDYTLVIAGAGAGKTTTVAAKVKYLVEKQNVDPKQILVISFTNKAVGELQDKINKGLNIPCPIATFHSTGNAIIRKQSPEPLNIVDNTKLYYVLQDYFKNSILKNEEMVNKLIMFFASYFDAPYEGKDLNEFFNKIAKGNYSTIKSDLDEYQKEIIDSRTKKAQTIQNEVLRSYQEVEIANFLYLNGIDYDYEPIYEYDIQYSRKPYTPDFRIKQGDNIAYIEHFGITQSGNSNRFSADELEFYKNAINDKVKLHREHNTTLIYTFSEYNDRRPIVDHLQEELTKHGFELKPRSNKEILEKLISSEESRYIRKLVSLITRFIQNFKVNGYDVDEFSRMYHQTQNVRSRLFLDICNDCYIEYQRYLKENQAVDFEDMINESAKLLRNVKEMKQKLDFKYIIVDEYQDISRQRFDLVSALHEVTDAKIVAVGDDWQSIYAFSGSDITLFTHFEEKMGYAKQLKIRKTYRNSQQVIDIAGKFIQENDAQIKKDLVSPKNIENPVIIYTYDNSYKKPDGSNRSGADYAMAMAVQAALEQIMAYNKEAKKADKDSSILFLGRFGFDGDRLERTGLFEYITREGKLKCVKYPWLNITFMTAHASKGLGYDNVIVVNGKNETYGFPSKIEDDPVLAFVIKGDRSIDFAEERRLFYVAMTRTKNRVYFVAPEKNPSEFLLELKHNNKTVVLRGDWDENSGQRGVSKHSCPICGYPMQFRYKTAYGLRLWLCTNEPEVCGFMTNDLNGQKLSIMKCDSCRSGYLIVKRSSKDHNCFLGCTNYSKSGHGCNRIVTKEEYYKMMNLSPDPVIIPQEPKKTIVSTTISPTPARNRPDTIRPVKKADLSTIYHGNYSINDVIYTVLCCLVSLSENKYFGISVLLDVLRGGNTEKIRQNKLTELSEYGALKYVPYKDLRTIVEWMIDKHFILKTNHPQYPVLHPTYEGNNYKDILTFEMLIELNNLLDSSKDS